MQSTGNFAKQKINSISFNTDNTFMAVATSKGFKIYSVQPFILRHSRDFGTPLQFVQLIERSNLVGLVGQKQTPFTPPNRLAIFDDKTQKIIADLTFPSKIKQIKIRLGKIVIALYNKVFLVDLLQMQIQHIIETFKFEESQIYNLISLSSDRHNFIMAAPGVDNGNAVLVYLNRMTQRKVKAHQSILSAVLLTQNGQKLATTSQKGIQVRIFDTKTGQMLQQVRRGNQFATIYSIAFSRQGNWLAISSDSCNLHIFVVKPTEAQRQKQYKLQTQKTQLQNPKSLFSFLKKFIPYFDAQYSFCYHKYEQYDAQMKTWLAFGLHDDNLVSVSNYQNYQKLELNTKGGRCRLIQKTGDILNKQIQQKYK